MDPKTLDDGPLRRPWAAPAMTELDIAATQNGAAPNIEETLLTDSSLAPS